MPKRSPQLKPWGAAAVAAGLLSGCALPFPDPPVTSRGVDPTSPVADRILREDNAEVSPSYPRFSDIPAVPTDVRPPEAWNAAVGEVQAERAELDRWLDANPPELTDTEAFAERQRNAVGLDPLTLPAAPTPEESAAYARQQRERATPR